MLGPLPEARKGWGVIRLCRPGMCAARRVVARFRRGSIRSCAARRDARAARSTMRAVQTFRVCREGTRRSSLRRVFYCAQSGAWRACASARRWLGRVLAARAAAPLRRAAPRLRDCPRTGPRLHARPARARLGTPRRAGPVRRRHYGAVQFGSAAPAAVPASAWAGSAIRAENPPADRIAAPLYGRNTPAAHVSIIPLSIGAFQGWRPRSTASPDPSTGRTVKLLRGTVTQVNR